MSATLLTQLETAETIPAGSLYMMEAGDGSGTKTVTQETLEQKMGQALKVGDLTELATEEKETLVGAINEAAQSGGGAAVDVLDSREEIEANTQSGKSAGALAVKEMVGELNSKITDVETISINNCRVSKRSGMVYIDFIAPSINISKWSNLTIATLQEGYRPVSEHNTIAIIHKTAGTYIERLCRINTNGTIVISNSTAEDISQADQAAFSTSYLCAE